MKEDTVTYEISNLSPEGLTSLLPGFQVNELLSCSSSGTIYRGKQISLDRDVTFKVLPAEITANPSINQAFSNDAKAMAKLNHENLVDVYDFGEVNGMLYMIIEHIPGRSLYETAHDKHVAEEEASELVRDLCLGLHCAHEAGVIHRGLNPTNILINHDAEAKIVDFGISAFIHNDLIDNPDAYSSPEVLLGNETVDEKADIYSAGIILYELIVGYTPTNPYTPPSTLRETSPFIDSIILRALQPDPNNRYATAKEMANDLEDFLDSLKEPEAIEQPTDTRLTAAAQSTAAPLPITKLSDVKSNNAPAVLVTLLIIAGICYGAYRYYQSLSLEPSEDKQKTEFIIRESL